MNQDTFYTANVSRGKDSTAMLLAIKELGWPLDEVVAVDVWDVNYINNRNIRLPVDRDVQIEQIEHAYGISFIVEVWNPKEDEEG